MDKRYQVFISSTYADLKEERRRVMQTVMEMDCIPAGMELFPAADEEQFEFIKRVIDDCDYYLLIIGGRYGSLTAEGISYTEKEYDYAVSKGIKVIGLIHENPEEIPLGKSEKEPALREKLGLFRKKVSTGRMVKFWKSADELPGLVSLSLSKTIKMFPALGWVRPNTLASEQVLTEVNDLRKQNDTFRNSIAALQEKVAELESPPIIENLARLEDKVRLHGKCYNRAHNRADTWAIELTWAQVFLFIAPYLQMLPSDGRVTKILADAAFAQSYESSHGYNPSLDDQTFRTIALQLTTLGLVTTVYAESTRGTMALFWRITPQGNRLMIEQRTVKKASKSSSRQA